MRILHLLRAPMGGVLRHVRDLSLAQTNLGYDVGIICDVPGTDGYNEETLTMLSANLALGVQRVPMSRSVGLGDISTMRKMSSLIDPLAPDVLHGHGAKGGLFSRRCGSSHVKRFYSPHGGSLHYDPKRPAGMLFFQVERYLERYTDRMLFVADFERRTFEKKIGALKADWSVVYNGLSDDEFEPVPLVIEPKDFLFIGEMRDLKGVDLIIEATKKLTTSSQKPSAVFVGAGPQRQDYQQQVEAAGLSGQIEFCTPMPARNAFALARNVVLPSRAEAMPYIVIEALAAGKPVITTSVGGIPEVFGEKAHTLISADVGELTSRMENALNGRAALIADMPDVEALKKRFSVSAMVDAVMAAYATSGVDTLYQSKTA